MTQGNPLLAQAKAKIAESVPDQFDEAFLEIVKDGRKFFFGPLHEKVVAKVQAITGPQDVPAKVAEAVAEAISVIAQKGNVPANPEHPFYVAAQPAAQSLACDALEFIEQKKQIPVTPDLLAATIKAVVQRMMQLYGITGAIAKKAYDAAQQQAPAQAPPPPQAPPTGVFNG